MPITFPAHAAAILPFHRRALPGTALVVGSAVPDFAFLVNGAFGVWSHRVTSLLLFCVPVGLVIYAALEAFILPAIRDSSSTARTVLASRGLAPGPRGWLTVVIAVVVGASTHLLWDSFTHHDRWPGSAIFSEQGAALAHVASSAAGTLIILTWALRAARAAQSDVSADHRLGAFLAFGATAGALLANCMRATNDTLRAGLSVGWVLFAGAFVGVLAVAVAHEAVKNTRGADPESA